MMKTDILKLGLLIFLCNLFISTSQAQTSNYLVIKGLVILKGNSTDSCFILISGSSDKVLKAPVDINGRFRLELKYNSEYKLTFQKPDHHSKTILVNTALPNSEVNQNRNIPQFLMAVRLMPNNDPFIVDKTQYIGYSMITGSFGRVITKSDSDNTDQNLVLSGADLSQTKLLNAVNYLLF